MNGLKSTMVRSITSFGWNLLSNADLPGCCAIHIIMSSSLGATAFVVVGILSVVTLKELNTQVTEPYMVSHASGASFSVVASVQSLTRMWAIG